MFKKFSKHPENPSTLEDLSSRPPNPFTTDLMNVIDPQALDLIEEENEEPETTIAEGVSIKGSLQFQRLLRIDGRFEGELLSSGKLIIGPTGSLKANIHLEEAFISGKVIGDIHVKKRLVLRGRADVRGDITAPLISIDEGVSIVGILNIAQTQTAPTDSDFDEDHYSSDN